MKWLVVGDMGLTQATVKRLSEGENRSKIITASFLLQATLTLLIVGGLVLFKKPINEYIGGEFALVIAGLFAVNHLISGTARQILRGYQAVHTANILTTIERVLRTVFQVALVMASLEVMGLFLGMGASVLLVGTAGLFYVYVTLDIELAVPDRATIVSLIDYAKYSVLGVVKSQSFTWTDIVVMGFFVESAVVGIYNVSWSIAMVFLMFGNAITQNLFPEISSLMSDGNNERTRNLISEGMIYASLFPIAGIVGALIVGDSVLSIYGPEFTQGQSVLVILGIVALLRSYEGQILALLDGIDRPDLTFKLNLLFTVSNLSLNVFLVPRYGAHGAAIATASSLALMIIFGYRISKQFIEWQFPVVEVGKQIVAAGVMGSVVLIGTSVVPSQRIVYLLPLIALGGTTYFVCLFVLSRELRTKFHTTVMQQLV
ncbi:hypothetical protein GCM10028856_16370 [Halopiger thermotolerans]